MQKRFFLLVVTVLMLSLSAVAQVTTSGITGIVTAGGEEAIGATITAKHVPSGSVYRAVTNVNGRYTITGMRSGGPYEVEVSYIGYQTTKMTGFNLALGQNTVVDASLKEGSEMLQEVLVVAQANNTMRSDRSGAVTNVDANAMANVPTIGRSMTDIMKLTPQSSSASGMAIGGGNYRQSSVTVDGASFNNAFGLGSSPLPGGGTPISLDALDQMTISITPYDVRQSGFTGGGINAVTKSGTNEFKGSLYTYLTSTSLKGNRVGNTVFDVDNGHTNTYGATFGGPIIKDKLFFFLNGEYEDNVIAGPIARAGDGSLPYSNTNRRPQIEELDGLSSYLQNTYGLTTGPWQGYNIKTPAYRILARVDWNINDNHKFNIRFTKSNRKSSSMASASRSVGSNRSNDIYGGSNNTYGSNTNYGMSSLSSRYYAEVKGLEQEPEGGARCEVCFRMRLEEAAIKARELGLDYFTTTLTISPMKDPVLLNSIGEEMAKKYGVEFLPSEFRKKNGFKRSTELSQEYGLYRQDFCGCVFSQREAEERRKRLALEHDEKEKNEASSRRKRG